MIGSLSDDVDPFDAALAPALSPPAAIWSAYGGAAVETPGAAAAAVFPLLWKAAADVSRSPKERERRRTAGDFETTRR